MSKGCLIAEHLTHSLWSDLLLESARDFSTSRASAVFQVPSLMFGCLGTAATVSDCAALAAAVRSLNAALCIWG